MDWPMEVHDIQIDLMCAKKWREKAFQGGQLLDPGEHMLRAIRALFDHEDWSISPWTEEHAHGWCEEGGLHIMGCASSSKSNDIGGLCTLDWITDPSDTITIMASTSKTALADRSYESVIRYFKLLKANPHFFVPGKESKTQMAIMNDDADDYGKLSTSKSAIRGVAVQAGTADEARANLVGRHMPYVRLICDEFAQMREAAAEARVNLSIGAEKDFKWCTMANPDHLLDMSGRYMEPIEGWGSVDENTPEWRSRYGRVLHRNGFQSPAVVEEGGKEKYPYLINMPQIEQIIYEENDNADAVSVWTMVKGFPPPAGSEQTVISETDLVAFGMRDPVEWDHRGVPPVRVAGLDPAFTADGDGCVLQPATVGLAKEGVLVCAFEEPIYIKLEASNPRPAIYQVVDQVREHCFAQAIPIENVMVDDSGVQSVADVMEIELDRRPMRCQFGGSASELPVSSKNPKPAKDRFRNQATEIWMLTAELGRARQLRNFPLKAAQQFCSRRFRARTAAGSGKRGLEGKADFKKRLVGQRSPDEGDALALCVAAARAKGGLISGKDVTNIRDVEPRMGFRPRIKRALSRNYTQRVDAGRLSIYSKPRK
tara:strand:+ start:2852 stop:4645 length:1794 start_codon:yes stop_codon:yes gene_type:complete